MKKYGKNVIAMALVMSCMTGLVACGDETSNAETVATQNTEASVEESDATEEVVQETTEEVTEEQQKKEPAPYVDKLDRSDEGYILIWNDEFDGDKLDTTKWDYQYGNGGEYGNPGWGNYELEYYLSREENVRVEDGKLIITAMKEDTAMPYTSGRIRTITNRGEVLFATTYGRIEARIKMPAAEGLWPAFWMLPVDKTIYGDWAASGELDIMEAKGRLPEQFSAAAHFGRAWPNNTFQNKEYVFEDGTDITDYHLYSIEWEPDEIRWYVDNECFFTMTDWYSQDSTGTNYPEPAPFDVPFYIILNMAIGGTFDSQADVDNVEFPVEMEVDFVRVYQKEEGYGTETVQETEIAD